MVVRTRTDTAGPTEWLIHDEIIHFRQWGTDIIHALPSKRGASLLGSSEDCWLQVHDPTGKVSRQHAKLAHNNLSGQWEITDLQSKNGTFIDGARRMSWPIEAGAEIRLGGVTFIAESPLLCVLRELLARLIGWAEERRADVDLALRFVRNAATQRDSLLLCGEGPLPAVARLLHRHTLGIQRPFIVCDPRRKPRAPKAGRHSATYNKGMAALAAATGGTLCIWRAHPPSDYPAVRSALKDPALRVQLVVCTRRLPRKPDVTSQIVLPPLAHRTSEVNRIIDAYAIDAVVALDGTFIAADRDWVRQYASRTLSEIETATQRLVAIRGLELSHAAKRLGMSHGSLSTWFARRQGLPTKNTEDEDEDEDQDEDEDEDEDDE